MVQPGVMKVRQKTICVVGADGRQQAAAAALRRDGWTVLGAEGAGGADCILLPMPLDPDSAGLARILRAARPGAVALGGRVSRPVQEAADAAGVELIDYLLRPEFAILNAVPTAEGCLSLLLAERQQTVWQSAFLVLGGGRVAEALAVRLTALGGRVTVAARAPAERARALAAGCRAAPLTELPSLLPGCGAVVNTIPAPVLGAALLALLPGGALVIDLASKPGGVDAEAARANGVRLLHALSLPARCAPRTAGALVAHVVEAVLQERSAPYDQ